MIFHGPDIKVEQFRDFCLFFVFVVLENNKWKISRRPVQKKKEENNDTQIDTADIKNKIHISGKM